MGNVWQNILVGAVIATAVSYLAYRGWRTLTSSGKSGCGGCDRAGGGSAGESDERAPVIKPLITIDGLESPNREGASSRHAEGREPNDVS